MKPYLLLLLLLPLSFSLSAQYERKLEQSIRIYNKVKVQFEQEGIPYQQIEQSLEVCDLLLNEVIKYGSEQERKTGQYFYALKNLLRGEMLFRPDSPNRLLGETLLLHLADSFIQLDEAFFPIRYFYEDEYFIVDYEDFVGTRFRYFAEITELYYRKGEFDAGRNYARIALHLGASVDPYLSFFLMTYLLDMDPTAIETYEYARRMLQHYLSLQPSEQQQLNEDEQFATKALFAAFDQLSRDSLTIAYLDSTGLESAEIAEQLLPMAGFDSLATFFLEHAVRKDYAFPYPRSWDVLQLLDRYGHRAASKILCNRLAKLAPIEACYDWQRLSAYMEKYEEPLLAEEYRKVAEKCTKKRIKAEKKAAKKRRHR